MSANHEVPKSIDSKLKLGLALNTGFTVIEFTIGIFSGSLALISDAGHNLTDSLTLLITFFAQKISNKESNVEHTYGYGRITILAALINGLILFTLAFYIFYEAYQRFMNPQPVEGGIVMIVAFIGFVINLSVALLFRGNKGDINIKSAYMNMLFDALASVGALIAGFLIIVTKQYYFDSLISVGIGILLLRGSWEVVGDAIHVLLDGVPEGVHIGKVKEMILKSAKVKGVDDLHIWAVSTTSAALSCHVVIEDCSIKESIEIVKDIKDELKTKFHIQHSTIETELVECKSEA